MFPQPGYPGDEPHRCAHHGFADEPLLRGRDGLVREACHRRSYDLDAQMMQECTDGLRREENRGGLGPEDTRSGGLGKPRVAREEQVRSMVHAAAASPRSGWTVHL